MHPVEVPGVCWLSPLPILVADIVQATTASHGNIIFYGSNGHTTLLHPEAVDVPLSVLRQIDADVGGINDEFLHSKADSSEFNDVSLLHSHMIGLLQIRINLILYDPPNSIRMILESVVLQ
jgi:hypothetical protein